MSTAWRRLLHRLRGASSGVGGGFHLWWKGLPAGEPIAECSVVLEVLREPVVDKLYFWALQASFVDAAGLTYGAAHTGLQWNPRHPGNRAVNWGGYAHAADVGSVLDGTVSTLPGIPGDLNTRTFGWRQGVPYRFAIRRGEVGWAATVTDLVTGSGVTIRELFAGGDRLADFVMWSELFCRGDDPATIVRWSHPQVRTATDHTLAPAALEVTYPGGAEWHRLDVISDGLGVRQMTGTRRTTPHLAMVPVEHAAPPRDPRP
jgi:hypothetical protein